MDLADQAQHNDFTEAALIAHESGLQHRSGHSAYRCEECGDAIPEERRQAVPGTEHCAECQTTLEALQKRGLR